MLQQLVKITNSENIIHICLSLQSSGAGCSFDFSSWFPPSVSTRRNFGLEKQLRTWEESMRKAVIVDLVFVDLVFVDLVFSPFLSFLSLEIKKTKKTKKREKWRNRE